MSELNDTMSMFSHRTGQQSNIGRRLDKSKGRMMLSNTKNMYDAAQALLGKSRNVDSNILMKGPEYYNQGNWLENVSE